MNEDQEESELRPSLTDEFMSTLERAAGVYGDSGDSVAVMDFVRWVIEVKSGA